MKRYILAAIAMLIPNLILAQDDISARNHIAYLPSAGYFFLALIAGLIIAFAIQLLLTNLSVAAGLSMLKKVTDPANVDRKHKERSQARKADVNARGVIVPDAGQSQSTAYRSEANADYNRIPEDVVRKSNVKNEKKAHDHPKKKESTAKKINSAYGIWTLVTGAITMFIASWLAGEMSLTFSMIMGAVLGLAIWGLFYIVTTYLEIRAVSSLVGSVTRLALTGLRTSYNAFSSVFTSSPEKKMVKTSAKIARAVKRELFSGIDIDDIREQVEKLVEHVKPQEPKPEQIAREFARILDHTEIKAVVNHEGPMYEQDVIIASLQTDGMGRKKAEKLVDTVNDVFVKIKEEAVESDKDNVSKVADTVMRIAGMSETEAHQTRENVENYLRNTGKEDLNPESIKHDLEMLVKHPGQGFSSLGEKISHIDRDTLAKILAQRKDMTEEEARRIVDKVLDTAQNLGHNVVEIKDNILHKMSNYLNSLNRPELNYEGIKNDMKMMLFEDRKAGYQAMVNRLKSIDRDTIKAVIAKRKDISDQEADEIIQKIETTRDKMISKIRQAGDEINHRVYLAKKQAMRQADNVRSTAANAAWWAFSTATVSGLAAIAGGIVASLTGFRIVP